MGGSQLFRAFDLAERQGSTVWVGSVEWRVPVATDLHWDCCDHVLGLRNIYVAPFYDIGDAYINNRSVGPVAHGVGTGLRLDVAWFGFVERTTLRVDVAKALNSNNAVQVWFGVQHPF
jgi:hemolysin activation/secretion protein